MIFKDALRSLRDSMAKAVFFCLTFYLTTTLMFLFFNVAESSASGQAEVYVTGGQADIGQLVMNGDIGNLMMVFIVIMCAIDLIYANDFFVKDKAKEIAVRMICGATYIQVSAYLLIQTTLLMLIAIPLGIITAMALFSLMNSLLISVGSTFFVSIHSFAITQFVVVILFIIFWTMMLNLSFTYQSAATLMLSSKAKVPQKNSLGVNYNRVFGMIKKILWIIGLVACLVSLRNGGAAFGVFSVAGSICLNNVIGETLLPLLTKHIQKHRLSHAEAGYALGFARQDILLSKRTLLLVIADIGIVLFMMYGRDNNIMEMLLVLVTYIFICILQTMAMMFSLDMELSSRKRPLRILGQIGFSQEQISRTMFKEVTYYYVFALLCISLFLMPILGILFTSKQIVLDRAMLLYGIALAPLAVTYILTLRFYHTVKDYTWTHR